MILTPTNMLKNVFTVIVILFCIVIFFAMRNGKSLFSDEVKIDTTIVHDTTWMVKTNTVVREVPAYKTLPGETKWLTDTKYLPDTNYARLKGQFEALAKEHTSRKLYRDSIKIESFGYVFVNDTVRLNGLGKRTYKYDYKIPTVTKTVTITKPTPPKTQFYVGGGMTGTGLTQLSTAQVGLMMKTKKDLLIGGLGSVDMKGNLSYGVTVYYKIK